jgi:phospholipid transport system substrate-binding protein
VRVDWRVRGGKVIDVIVEGVSMSVTQRSEFSSIIQRNGGDIEALITHLQKT